MTSIDYIVIALYFIFILALGPVYKTFSKTSSDYFRGGGTMLWWMVGSSAFVMNFSAWSFVGGASRAYETGTYFLVLYGANVAALIVSYFFVAARIRNMRIITAVEGVAKRFGKGNEQFFAWLPLPFFLLMGSVGLYVIATFMAAVFQMPTSVLIPIIGVTVTFMALSGGSWSVIASDFVQLLTVVVITIIMAFLALGHPKVGGVSGLLEKMPEHHLDWSLFAQPWVIAFFCITLIVNQTININSLQQGAARYVFVKNGRDAKKAVIVQIVGFVLITPFWMIPAIAATILHPDLGLEYPHLNNPSEAAYVAVALTVLPKGLMGLLVCGIFAATMSTMDSGLNRAAGIMVRNVYLPLINPQAGEDRQLLVGKFLTGLFGVVMIAVALFFSTLKSMPIFNLILLVAATVGLPSAVPLFYGIFVKRTPAWGAWSTSLVGIAFGLALNIALDEAALQRFFGTEQGLSSIELADLKLSIVTASLFILCTAWYFMATVFAREPTSEEKTRVDAFFEDMKRPVDHDVEHGPNSECDDRQLKVIGNICLIYGIAIGLFAVIPNSAAGHASFLFCGGTIAGIGLFIHWIRHRKQTDSNEGPSEG